MRDAVVVVVVVALRTMQAVAKLATLAGYSIELFSLFRSLANRLRF